MKAEEIYREVGQNIRRYREDARRTQAQLAAQIGMSRASLANIEAGRQQVLLHYLYAIADALELPSPAALMPKPQVSAQGADVTVLPLPQEGLSEKQRQEVLRLMGGVLNNNNKDKSRENG